MSTGGLRRYHFARLIFCRPSFFGGWLVSAAYGPALIILVLLPANASYNFYTTQKRNETPFDISETTDRQPTDGPTDRPECTNAHKLTTVYKYPAVRSPSDSCAIFTRRILFAGACVCLVMLGVCDGGGILVPAAIFRRVFCLFRRFFFFVTR